MNLKILIFVILLFHSYNFASAEENYRYDPGIKTDPFAPINLSRPTVRGMGRLQEYELSQLELVGTVLAADVTALLMTPEPREGLLARIGDRVGKKGGRIISITRTKIIVREPIEAVGLNAPAGKFNDVIIELAKQGRDSSGRMLNDTNVKPGGINFSSLGAPGFNNPNQNLNNTLNGQNQFQNNGQGPNGAPGQFLPGGQQNLGINPGQQQFGIQGQVNQYGQQVIPNPNLGQTNYGQNIQGQNNPYAQPAPAINAPGNPYAQPAPAINVPGNPYAQPGFAPLPPSAINPGVR